MFTCLCSRKGYPGSRKLKPPLELTFKATQHSGQWLWRPRNLPGPGLDVCVRASLSHPDSPLCSVCNGDHSIRFTLGRLKEGPRLCNRAKWSLATNPTLTASLDTLIPSMLPERKTFPHRLTHPGHYPYHLRSVNSRCQFALLFLSSVWEGADLDLGASGWKPSVRTAREGRLGPEILRERDFQGDLEKPLCGAEGGPAVHLREGGRCPLPPLDLFSQTFPVLSLHRGLPDLRPPPASHPRCVPKASSAIRFSTCIHNLSRPLVTSQPEARNPGKGRVLEEPRCAKATGKDSSH
ncbi:uncharacterized protein LOC115297590 [Suricata suricatta]|uniref:uncharacterized protein LOC115297590 n=1 Tax=Suricata suricatta TaxID=37032 RepID=UPI001155C17E|nr:uncharacterized protein LOC115297590 [Suricata suricatta]